MSDSQIPILTKPPEDTTEKVTAVMTELTDQTKFLSDTLNKSIKSNEKIEKKNDDQKKKEDQVIKSEPKEKSSLASDAVKSGVNAGINTMKLAQETFLGDISFVTDPIKKMGGIFKDIGGFFGLRKKKVPPKRSAMLKTNPEAVYITDTLLKEDKKGGTLMDKIKGFLPALLGGSGVAAGLAKLGPALMKTGAIGMIVGSLVWMAIDGFKAYAKAGEWGVSKTSAVIGGVLGGTGKGWKNAFKGMGKWALMGAGVGLLFGPVGALVGGLLGAAVGGILGFIGGENIAKGLDKMGSWFKNVFWGGLKKGASTIGAWFIELPGMLAEGFKEGWDQFKSEMGAVADFAKVIWEKISPVFTSIGNTVSDIFNSVVEGVKSFIEDPIGFGKNLIKSIIGKVTDLFDSIKQGFTDFISDPVGFTKELLKPVKDFFGKIGSIFGTMFGWLVGYEPPEIDEKAVEDAKKSSGYNSYFGGTTKEGLPPGWTKTSNGFFNTNTREFSATKPVNDAILRPDGSIVETHPNDTIIATKNPIAFADKESNSMTNDINKPQSNITANLESLIKQLIQKQQVPNQSNMIQQNITSRYNPQAIMANLTTEVF